MTETRCVNDTNGDGDCATCARNPNAPCRVPVPDREVLGQVIRIAYLKAMGAGPEVIAFAQSRDDDPETRQRWHQIADAILSHVEPPADPYAYLTRAERRRLANYARRLAEQELDARNYTTGKIHPDGGQILDESWHTRQERHDRWREIADGLHANQGVTGGS